MCNSYYSPIRTKYCVNGRDSYEEDDIPELTDPKDCYHGNECMYYLGDKTCHNCKDYDMFKQKE